MEELNEFYRYYLLAEQFSIEKIDIFHAELRNSLKRIMDYIYECTNITFIEFIDEEVLYNYIRYHRKSNFTMISFVQVIKDIKAYLFFLKKIKKKNEIPSIDLSVKNYTFWARL